MARLFTALMLLLVALLAHAGEVEGSVTDVTADYGNIDTDITYQQLESLGVNAGDEFTIKFGGKRVTAHFGTTYGDVPKGEWVGVLNGMGTLRLARNFANAAETLGVRAGDTLTIATRESATTQ